MKYEENNNERVDNNVRNILKILYPRLEEGKFNTVEEAMEYLNNEIFV